MKAIPDPFWGRVTTRKRTAHLWVFVMEDHWGDHYTTYHNYDDEYFALCGETAYYDASSMSPNGALEELGEPHDLTPSTKKCKRCVELASLESRLQCECGKELTRHEAMVTCADCFSEETRSVVYE